MATDFSPDALRKRFHSLSDQRAKIDAKLEPLRAKLDAGSGKTASADEKATRDQIVKLQAELAPIEQERAALARALNGNTGLPASVEKQIKAAAKRR